LERGSFVKSDKNDVNWIPLFDDFRLFGEFTKFLEKRLEKLDEFLKSRILPGEFV